MSKLMPNTTSLAHLFVRQGLFVGSVAIDATVGNGNDTLFLAELVGETGRVYGFDIQEKAIASTKERLAEAGVLARVELFHAGHEKMSSYIREQVDLIMFNLGYLPGSSHQIITKPDTTVEALRQGLELLNPGGLLTAVVYPGHAGGNEEAAVVDEFVGGLSKKLFSVVRVGYVNRSQNTPYLVVIENFR